MTRDAAREFARRRQLPGVEVRYYPAGRTFTVALRLRGRDIGQKCDVTTRGRVTTTAYVLPPFEDEP